MLNLINGSKFFCTFIVLFCSALNVLSACEDSQEMTKADLLPENKTHLVVAMPFQPNLPLDPHWYTADYVDYIASLLPSERYSVSGYFVSLQNIPQFLDDMQALQAQKKNVRILNVCDGGEWDGYPCISVLTQWKEHPVSALIPMTGADAQFILNSDDKTTMQSYISQANLKALPQALVAAQTLDKINLSSLLEKQQLDQAWPLFCKLNIGAGALGISPASICQNIEELTAQLHKVQADFPKSDILIQPYLAGPEYTIFVLKERVYVAVQRDFHNPSNLMLEDYLTDVSKADEEISYYPAPQHVQDLAIKAIQAIPGKHHYTRVDLRNDAKGNTYVLDINDRPGFGNPSTIKCMLDFHHLSEAQLLLDIVETCQ